VSYWFLPFRSLLPICSVMIPIWFSQ
jgi:hypothetical protein